MADDASRLSFQPAPRTARPDAGGTRATAKPRLLGLDLARGLAVLGMFVAHTAATGAVGDGSSARDLLLGLADGRPSILFALLAGISLGILTGRPAPYTGDDAVRARVRVLVRAVILLGVAGVLAMLDSQVAIILAFYSAWFMIVLPFVQRSTSWIFTAAVLIAVFGPLLRLFIETAAPVLGLYLETGDPNQFFVATLVSGFYPGLAYLAIVFAGLGLSRLDLAARAVQLNMVAAGALLALIGYGVGLVGLILVGDDLDPGLTSVEAGAGLDTAALGQLVIATPHSGTTWELLGSGGVAIAVTGLLLMLPARAGWALAPLAAVGSMSLTAYSAHVAVLGMFPQMVSSASLWPAVGLVVGALILCWAWRAAFGRGPLERVMYEVSVRATR